MPAYRVSGGRVTINGVDISGHVRAFEVHAAADSAMTVTLTLWAIEARMGPDGSLHLGVELAEPVPASGRAIRVRGSE